VETEGFEYREGGVNEYVHRFAGPTKHPVLTLKHGLSPIDGLWSWHQDVVAGVIRRRNGTIYLLDRQLLPVMWWDFKEALPMKWSGPALSAAAGAVAFESVEIAHHGLSRPRLATAVAGVAGEVVARARNAGGFF
jgi:phage tail-like protein